MRGSHQPLPKSGFAPAEDDGDAVRAASVGLRKKATGVRPWLLLDAAGQGQVVEAGKHAIMRRTGLPARDLRILDPLLSYPSTVLGRERAIVINLEHIKAIITAQEVLLLNSRDPSVMPFVEELQRRILRHHHAITSQEGGFNADDTDWSNLYDLVEPQSRLNSPQKFSGVFPEKDEEGNVDGKQTLENQDGLKVLPFEFIALEACLEAACSCLENEARTLEQEAHPALDKLTSKISTLNLERVRQIKSRLVAITGRVQKVRDELEHLLDDDEDMAEMYLTDKMVQQHLDSSSQSSMNEQDGTDDDVLRSEADYRIPAEISLEGNGGSTSYEGDLQNLDNPQEQLYASHLISRGSHGTRTSTTRSAISKQLDVEELEMLLEAYFVQIDGTLNKLSTLREYVDDTEDYINIMLDDKQNHLLQMGVMLTTATLVVSAFVVVAGIFGMNIKIDLFNEEKAGMQEFLWTVGGSATGSIFLYVIAIAWCKHKRLLEERSFDMANAQCCANAPTLSSTCGGGLVEDFGGLKTYIAGSSNSKNAILLVSDVFGYEAPNLRKLADKAAAAGYLVVVPDFLYGDPFVPNNPHRSFQAWANDHQAAKVAEEAIPVIEALKNKGVSKIGAAGFCWGAQVIVELAKHPYIDAAVLLHSSFVTLDGILGVKVPISILGAEIDQISPPELLKQFGDALEAKKEIDHFLKIFPGVTHGWTVKYKSDDPEAVKCAEEAHKDMMDWFAKYIC